MDGGLEVFADVFGGRRVFVTGHTGFKGAWLTEWLASLGADVTGYALDPPTQPSLFDALPGHPEYDLPDRGLLRRSAPGSGDRKSVV